MSKLFKKDIVIDNPYYLSQGREWPEFPLCKADEKAVYNDLGSVGVIIKTCVYDPNSFAAVWKKFLRGK